VPSDISSPGGQTTSLSSPQTLVTSLAPLPALSTVLSVGQGPAGVQGAPELVETGPSFTYTSGTLTRIDYDSGNYKLLSYQGGNLATLDYVRASKPTIRKTFNYDAQGNLIAVDQTTL
jgi:hypothetical protein